MSARLRRFGRRTGLLVVAMAFVASGVEVAAESAPPPQWDDLPGIDLVADAQQHSLRIAGADRYETSLALALTRRGAGDAPYSSPDRSSGGATTLAGAGDWWGTGVCPRSIIVVAGDVAADALAAAPLSDPTGLSREPRLRRTASADPLFDPVGAFVRVDTDHAPIIVTESARGGATVLSDPARIAAADLRTGGCRQARSAIVVGGTAAVPAGVDQELLALGYADVYRIAGSNRYDTAAAIGASLGTVAPPGGSDCLDERADDGDARRRFLVNAAVEFRPDATTCELLRRTVVVADGVVGADALSRRVVDELLPDAATSPRRLRRPPRADAPRTGDAGRRQRHRPRWRDPHPDGRRRRDHDRGGRDRLPGLGRQPRCDQRRDGAASRRVVPRRHARRVRQLGRVHRRVERERRHWPWLARRTRGGATVRWPRRIDRRHRFAAPGPRSRRRIRPAARRRRFHRAWPRRRARAAHHRRSRHGHHRSRRAARRGVPADDRLVYERPPGRVLRSTPGFALVAGGTGVITANARAELDGLVAGRGPEPESAPAITAAFWTNLDLSPVYGWSAGFVGAVCVDRGGITDGRWLAAYDDPLRRRIVASQELMIDGRYLTDADGTPRSPAVLAPSCAPVLTVDPDDVLGATAVALTGALSEPVTLPIDQQQLVEMPDGVITFTGGVGSGVRLDVDPPSGGTTDRTYGGAIGAPIESAGVAATMVSGGLTIEIARGSAATAPDAFTATWSIVTDGGVLNGTAAGEAIFDGTTWRLRGRTDLLAGSWNADAGSGGFIADITPDATDPLDPALDAVSWQIDAIAQ